MGLGNELYCLYKLLYWQTASPSKHPANYTHTHTQPDTRLGMIYGHIQSLQSSAWRRGSSLNLALIAAVAASATMWQEGGTATL